MVDNHGDLGVCWRLATQLAQRGKQVTLYVDDARALSWMAPLGCVGVAVLAWPTEATAFDPHTLPQVVIEAFGCALPQGFQAAMAQATPAPVWINLEYFSAETSAQRNHGLPSPVMSGPAKGLTKWFFYPGLGPHSGGVLGPGPDGRSGLAKPHSPSSTHAPRIPHDPLNISLFCYEPASLGLWLEQLNQASPSVHLRVTAGRATAAVRQALLGWQSPPRFTLEELPYLAHPAFDQMLAEQDLNLVRGEDSLVRAIWAGKAFLWQIYPQDDGAHGPKLQAFLHASQAPPVVVQAHLAWNADQATPLPALTAAVLAEWTAWARDLRLRLATETDLLSRLEGFVAAHG